LMKFLGNQRDNALNLDQFFLHLPPFFNGMTRK
jgi:hypothetical protein